MCGYGVVSASIPFVTSAHGCDLYKYANDTGLSQSAPLDDFCCVQSGIQTCIDHVICWMNSSKLMKNTNKTEVMALCTRSNLSLVHCHSANIRGNDIP